MKYARDNIGISKPINLRGGKEHPLRKKKKKNKKVELCEEFYFDVEDRIEHAKILGEL